MNKRIVAVVLAGGLLTTAVVAGPATAAKKKKPKPKPAACAPYTPGELGTDKPTVVVTDAATADAPLEQKVTLAQSTSDVGVGETSFDAFNVQVDSAAAEAGLYVKLSFPTRRDYDLFLRYPDGSEGGSSHGFNTLYEDPTDAADRGISDPGHGGQTTDTSETVVGIKTSDCGGWTVDVQNHLGEGGDMSVQLWLGEIKIDPLAEGEAPA